MRPCHSTTTTLSVNGFVASDVSYVVEPLTFEHEHPLPFFAVVLAGGIGKQLGRLHLEVPPAGSYAMPAEVRHRDAFPAAARILTLEVYPSSPVGELCEKQLARVRRLRAPELSTLAQQIALELGREEDGVRSVAVEGLGLELIAAAIRSDNSAHGRSRPPRWLGDVDELLGERFLMSLRVGEIADAVHVHPAHLARVFRLHHGETIGRRVRRLRLDWAKARLIETDDALRDIAVSAGFAHQSHFSRVFKQATGLTPAQYRAKLRPLS
jgi:AraC family transcriptional regulator